VAAVGAFLFFGEAAAAVFVALAVRWLLELRRSALAARLPLTALDKVLAVAPVGYTVICFVAAGALADRLEAILGEEGATAWVPILGEVSRATGVWAAATCIGLAVATPSIVVFTVEAFFAKRLPELVLMGRGAVWSVLTGVAQPKARRPPAAEEDEDLRWKRLLA
jgi:hypothetical protein